MGHPLTILLSIMQEGVCPKSAQWYLLNDTKLWAYVPYGWPIPKNIDPSTPFPLHLHLPCPYVKRLIFQMLLFGRPSLLSPHKKFCLWTTIK